MSRSSSSAAKFLAVTFFIAALVAAFWTGGIAVHHNAPQCTTPPAAAIDPIQIVVEIKGPSEIPITFHGDPIEVTGQVRADATIDVHATPPATVQRIQPAGKTATCR